MVVIIVLLFLARTISQPPPAGPDRNRITLSKQDLDAYTLMAGAVEFDTSLLRPLSPQFRLQLEQLLAMVARRELADVIARLGRMRRPAAYESALLQLLAGVAYYELGQPEPALQAFRTGFFSLDTVKPGDRYTGLLRARLGFNCGYLFQFYATPESARSYYLVSREVLMNLAEPDHRLTAWVLNNLGLATEAAGDTATARQFYLQALNYLDTLQPLPEAERLRKNLRRHFRTAGADQRQP